LNDVHVVRAFMLKPERGQVPIDLNPPNVKKRGNPLL
jgi:hypothetical protein